MVAGAYFLSVVMIVFPIMYWGEDNSKYYNPHGGPCMFRASIVDRVVREGATVPAEPGNIVYSAAVFTSSNPTSGHRLTPLPQKTKGCAPLLRPCWRANQLTLSLSAQYGLAKLPADTWDWKTTWDSNIGYTMYDWETLPLPYAGDGSTIAGTVIFSGPVSLSIIALPRGWNPYAEDIGDLEGCSAFVGERLYEQVGDSLTVDVTIRDGEGRNGLVLCVQPGAVAPVGQVDLALTIKVPDVREVDVAAVQSCLTPCELAGSLVHPKHYLVVPGSAPLPPYNLWLHVTETVHAEMTASFRRAVIAWFALPTLMLVAVVPLALVQFLRGGSGQTPVISGPSLAKPVSDQVGSVDNLREASSTSAPNVLAKIRAVRAQAQAAEEAEAAAAAAREAERKREPPARRRSKSPAQRLYSFSARPGDDDPYF